MVSRIERDRRRFEEIVRGAVKEDLTRHLTRGELIGRKGKEFVSIPIPQIELPRFRYGRRDQGGVGQGPGAVGDPIGNDAELVPGPGEGPGAGNQPRSEEREGEVPIDRKSVVETKEEAEARLRAWT